MEWIVSETDQEINRLGPDCLGAVKNRGQILSKPLDGDSVAA